MKRIPVSEGSVRLGYRPLIKPPADALPPWRGEALSDLSRAENGLLSLARSVRIATAWRVAQPVPGLLLIDPCWILDLANEIEAAISERAPWDHDSGVSRETLTNPDGQE